MNILLAAFIISLGINLLMFLPAFIFKTDKLTDISYSVTFVVVAAYGFIVHDFDSMNLLIDIMIFLWALRLGSYLLIRIHKMGRDKRFDGMRENFFSFIKFWILQGLSVFMVMIPALLFLSNGNKSFTVISAVGIVIWFCGLLLETIADYQKYTFINNPVNKGSWIDQGVWKYSRHPNYLGEMMVWIGLYLFMVSTFSLGEAFIGSIGPLYIIILISFVSGVPLLEKAANSRWGDNPNYQKYKKRVGVLFPKLC